MSFRTWRWCVAAALLAAMGLGLIGCWQQAAVDSRFRTEFGCTEYERTFLGAGAWRFQGCGHEVTYVCAGGENNTGVTCIQQQPATAGGAARPAPPSNEPVRVRLEGTTVDGQPAVRFVVEPVDAVLEFAPARSTETVHVTQTQEGCDYFSVSQEGVTAGSLAGIDLIELSALQPSATVFVQACGTHLTLTDAEREELDRFVAHALRLRRDARR